MLKPKIPKTGEITHIDKELPEVPENKDYQKVSIFNRAWAFLDKKKTIIGGVAYIAGDALIGGKVGAILQIVGMVTTGVGLTHKAEKKLNEKTSGEKINWGEIIEKILNFFQKLLKKG